MGEKKKGGGGENGKGYHFAALLYMSSCPICLDLGYKSTLLPLHGGIHLAAFFARLGRLLTEKEWVLSLPYR